MEKKVKKIFCLMGYTGSGKDTIAKEVIKALNGKVKFLVSHTTRPIRESEKEGREYYFIDNKKFLKMKEENEFIETRVYHTKVEKNGKVVDDTWYYGLSIREVENCEYGLFIVDVNGFNELRGKYGSSVVVPIFINVKEETLKQRALNRGDLEDEVNRRLEDDKLKFRSFRVRVMYKNIFNNGDIQKAIDEIVTFIGNETGDKQQCKKKK